MSNFGLTIRFPLGVYQAHRTDRSPDPFPDPLRLQSVLLSVAAKSTETGEPTNAQIEALEWLESNPPSGIEFPRQMWLSSSGDRFIYRNVSVINAKRTTEERHVSDGMSIDGQFGFLWDNMPDSVAKEIEPLLSEIPYVGESVSMAIVEKGDVCPSLEIAPGASPFENGGINISIPLPGRTAHLREVYAQQYPEKPPTVSRDKFSKSEEPKSASPASRCKGIARYKPAVIEDKSAPWGNTILFEVAGKEIPRNKRVAFAVATHQALIRSIGFGASSLVTGKYEKNAPRPANRLSIQYIPADIVRRFANPTMGLTGGVLALMIPRDADPEEVEQIASALPSLKTIWGSAFGRRNVRFTGQVVNAADFWRPVSDGMTRVWKTEVPVVPETRPVRMKNLEQVWTLEDSALLSVAFVWKNLCGVKARGQERYLHLRSNAAILGARVLQIHSVTERASSFVHRMHKNVPVRPWCGEMVLDGIADSTNLIAIGQSRHMGGGLLVPEREIPSGDQRGGVVNNDN